MAAGSKHPIDLEMRWNFGDSRTTSLSLDEFLAQKETDGVEFFAGKEPWLKGLHKLNWQAFFRVCTQEMDDLFENKVFQYRWALRHPVVKEAMTRALGNRFPSR